MPHIQQHAVADHEGGFEHPEKPLVPYNRADSVGVEAGAGVDGENFEILDCAVDCSDHDEGGAGVQRDKHSP